jgi:hypothetical protein
VQDISTGSTQLHFQYKSIQVDILFPNPSIHIPFRSSLFLLFPPVHLVQIPELIKLTLSSATNATGIPSHGDGFLVVDDVLEVCDGARHLPSVDGLGGLAGVLEADT